MANCISNIIIKAANESLKKGQEKYATYFIKYTWYSNYQSQVDTILIEKGYENCIVHE